MNKNTKIVVSLIVVIIIGVFVYIQMIGVKPVEQSVQNVVVTEQKTTEQSPIAYEVINGVTVPPEPDPELNNATLAGVDVNENGVRDDVERWLTVKFGGTSDLPYAIAAAKESQKEITEPTPLTRDDALAQVSRQLCAVRGASRDVYSSGFGDAIANTESRKQALRAFNDVLIGYIHRELPPCAD